MNVTKQQAGGALAALLILLGLAGVVGRQTAPTPAPAPFPVTSTTTSLTTSTSTTLVPGGISACSTGPAVTASSGTVRYDRVPASSIATSPRCAVDVANLWAHGAGAGRTLADLILLTGQQRLMGAIGSTVATSDFSQPVCDAPTGSIRVYPRLAPIGTFSPARGSPIPWGPNCTISGGSDGNAAVIDTLHHEWDLWVASTAADQTAQRPQTGCQADLNNSVTRSVFFPNGLPAGFTGFDSNSSLCVAAAVAVTDSGGALADVSTYGGNSPASTGAGVIGSFDIVTPAEITAALKSGAHDLGHALKLITANTMPGPACPGQTPLNSPTIGTSCGVAYAPAGKIEKLPDVPNLPGTVPEGARFALVMTPAQVTAWLDVHAPTQPLRATDELLVNTLIDQGMILGDSGGNAELVGGGDPTGWAPLGVVAPGTGVLAGLFTASNVRELEPAVNHLTTGPSRYAGKADQITYGP